VGSKYQTFKPFVAQIGCYGIWRGSDPKQSSLSRTRRMQLGKLHLHAGIVGFL
jgi:hypothetical protein